MMSCPEAMPFGKKGNIAIRNTSRDRQVIIVYNIFIFMKKFQLLIITVITIISFINIFWNGFAIDDKTFVGGWESAKHLSNIPKFFTEGAVPEGHQGVYRPIRNSLITVYYKVFGTNAFWYHVHSLAVHLASTILVFYIVRLLLSSRPVGIYENPNTKIRNPKQIQMTKIQNSKRFGHLNIRILNIVLNFVLRISDFPLGIPIKSGFARNDTVAFIAALLFALHPIHTETIDYISASLDATGLVFLFLSFYLYLVPARRGLAKLGSLIFAFLAFFTYEVTLVLPLLIVLYEVCMGSLSSRNLSLRSASLSLRSAPLSLRGAKRRSNLKPMGLLLRFRLIAMTTPYFALAIIYFVIRFFLLHITERGPYLAGSMYLTFLTMTKVFLKYIMLMLWPVDLSLNHIVSKGIEAFVYRDYRTAGILAQSLFDIDIVVSIVIIVSLLILAWKIRKKFPLITFGIGWFFITLLPVSEIVPQGSMMNERFMYLPSFGFVLILSVMPFVMLNLFQHPSTNDRTGGCQ